MISIKGCRSSVFSHRTDGGLWNNQLWNSDISSRVFCSMFTKKQGKKELKQKTMTGRRKPERGLEKWKIRHGGLHQLFEKNAQEVTFLTPLPWLDLCSTLWKIFNITQRTSGATGRIQTRDSENREDRLEGQSSAGSYIRQRHRSDEPLTSTGWITRRRGIIFMVVQSPGTMIYTHQSKIWLLRQIFLRYSADHLSFWNIFNITLTFLIGKSSNVDSQRRQSGALHSADANVCLLPSNNVDWPSLTSYLIDFLDHHHGCTL